MAKLKAFWWISGVVAFGLAVPDTINATDLAFNHKSSALPFSLQIAGFAEELVPCSAYVPEEQASCEETHVEIAGVLDIIRVSRRGSIQKLIAGYTSHKLDGLSNCLRTTCNGNFIIRSNSIQWAERWEKMLAFQACIHAVPAAQIEEGDKYSAGGRFHSALEGDVPECNPSSLSEADVTILSGFNLHGVY
jgi:hypothetical protein